MIRGAVLIGFLAAVPALGEPAPREEFFTIQLRGRKIGYLLDTLRQEDVWIHERILHLETVAQGRRAVRRVLWRREFAADPPHRQTRAFWRVEGEPGEQPLTPAGSLGEFLAVDLATSCGFPSGIEMRRAATREEAVRMSGVADLDALALIPVDRSLGTANTVRALVLEVEGRIDLAEGPRQSTVREAGRTLLRLGARHGRPQAVGPLPPVPPGSADPRIRETALRIAGGAKGARERVERLLQFVWAHVQEVATPEGAPVLRVLEEGRGDCTERMDLFLALAGAVEVPARPIHGLVYLGDDLLSFGPHAWCEVALDGLWVPVDPSWNEVDLSATHIALGAEGWTGAERARFRLLDVERGE